MNKVSLESSIKRIWGNNCLAYELLNQGNLSINHEVMPPYTSEVQHYHASKNQFFYCLHGPLTIEAEGETFVLNQYEGFYVKANVSHVAKNLTHTSITFLVISDTNTIDRIEGDSDNEGN